VASVVEALPREYVGAKIETARQGLMIEGQAKLFGTFGYQLFRLAFAK